MSPNQIFLFLVITAGISYVISETVTEEDVEEFHYDCKKLVWRIAKKVLKQFRECSGELKQRIKDEKERSKFIQCAVKCTLIRLEMVNNGTGLITDEDADRFLSKMVKPQFFDVARVIIGGCVEDFDAVSEADRNSEHCHAYGDVLKCLQNQITEIC